jgi:hypothetical protein
MSRHSRAIISPHLEEDVAPAAVALHADRELVRKMADGVVVALTEDEMRVLVLLEAGLQQAENEVVELVCSVPGQV